MPAQQQLPKYNILTIVSVITLTCYMICAYLYSKDVGSNKCTMTYMFEFPQFVKITVPDQYGYDYRRYWLFSYSEGKYTESSRAMKFSGIPVLFIPGHGGSCKQVRSLASVTTHRTLDLQSIFHFDFFTADFNGEYSALYGVTLKSQHEFIVCSIKKILSLYPAGNRPESVILIGHSMGGIIAKSLFLSSQFNNDWVKLIITLATPHKPVLLMDKDLYDFYQVVDAFWYKLRNKKSSRLQNVTLISIGAGARDMVVKPGLSYDKYTDLNVLTNAIPNVITSMDHLCITWCNSFVKTLSRALYDAVDFDVKGITLDKEHLKKIFYYHLVHCSNGKYYTSEIHQERLKFSNNNTTWREIKQTQISLEYRHGLPEDTYVLIKKPAKTLAPKYEIMVEAVNIEKRDWIGECTAHRTDDNKRIYCEDGNNLSQFGVIGFNKTMGRKYFQTNFVTTRELTSKSSHFVVKMAATKKETGLNVDIYSRSARTLKVDLNFYTFYDKQTILRNTEPGALFYHIKLDGMTAMWKMYRLFLTPTKCSKSNHLAYAVFKTPWNHDGSHAVISSEEMETLKLILLTIPPTNLKQESGDETPSVDLLLDPACQYSVEIDASYRDSLGLIATRYSFALFANMATIVLSVLAQQYADFQSGRLFSSFFKAMEEGNMPWFTLPVARFITYTWEKMEFVGIPFKLDTLILQDDTADALLVPVILYLVAYAIVHLTVTAVWIALELSVTSYMKYIGNSLDFIEIPSLRDLNLFRRTFVRFPISYAMMIVFVSVFTCGTNGLLVGVVMYFLKICSLYKKVLEADTGIVERTCRSIRTAEDDLDAPRICSVHFQITMFMIWTLCAVIYIPSLVMWYDNLEFEIMALDDPSYAYSVTLSLSLSVFWWCDNCPYVSLPFYKKVCFPLFITAASLLLTCQVNIYRLPYILTPVFVTIAMHQYYGVLRLRKYLNRNYYAPSSDNDNPPDGEGAPRTVKEE